MHLRRIFVSERQFIRAHFAVSTPHPQISEDLPPPKVQLALMPHSLECSPWTSSLGITWELVIFAKKKKKNAEWPTLSRPTDSGLQTNKTPRWFTDTMKFESSAGEVINSTPWYSREGTWAKSSDFPEHPTAESSSDSRIPILQCNFWHYHEPLGAFISMWVK